MTTVVYHVVMVLDGYVCVVVCCILHESRRGSFDWVISGGWVSARHGAVHDVGV